MNHQLWKMEILLNQTHNQATPYQTLSQEQKLNLENLKRIMNSEKTTLPSLRNIEWRTETNKVNQLLTYISTNNITELNELI